MGRGGSLGVVRKMTQAIVRRLVLAFWGVLRLVQSRANA